MSSITVNLVTVDGRTDEEASTALFTSLMKSHIASRELELETIADAVGAVFEKYKGTSINMPALCNFALQELNAQPENYKVLQERTAQYVRDNAQGDKDKVTGKEPRPDSLFVIGKGVGGGVHRRADRPAKPAANAPVATATVSE